MSTQSSLYSAACVAMLVAEIEAQARIRGLMPETLVNLWLTERLHQT
jgi:hypothetical protein